MGNVVKEMGDKPPNRFAGFYIFLATLVTKPTYQFRIAIQTNFFGSFLEMRQWVNFD